MQTKTTLCVIGTRPEAVKMAPIIHELRRYPDCFEVQVLLTAQHRHMTDQMLGLFGIEADIDLDIMTADQTLSDITVRVLNGVDRVFRSSRPDVVLAQGDTTTVMAAAMACFYSNVPFAHVEAGLRTGDCWAPFPEEFNRRVAGIVARYHFAPTRRAAMNLRGEGVDPARIFLTGNTVIDALQSVLASTVAPVSPVPDGAPYILMTCHRREIFGDKLREVLETVRDFARQNPRVYVWYPVHPNSNVRSPAAEILSGTPNILMSDPLDYVAFLHAMKNAYLVLTDSGGVQEEAPALNKPVLVLRDITERPEGVEAGACRLVGPHRDRIRAALEQLFSDQEAYRRMAMAPNPYGDGHASRRIVSALRGLRQDWEGGAGATLH